MSENIFESTLNKLKSGNVKQTETDQEQEKDGIKEVPPGTVETKASREQGYSVTNVSEVKDYHEGKGGSERAVDAKKRYTAASSPTKQEAEEAQEEEQSEVEPKSEVKVEEPKKKPYQKKQAAAVTAASTNQNKAISFDYLKMDRINKLSKVKRQEMYNQIMSDFKLKNHFIDVNFNEPLFEKHATPFYAKVYVGLFHEEFALEHATPTKDRLGADYIVKDRFPGTRNWNYNNVDLKTTIKKDPVSEQPIIVRLAKTDKEYSGDQILRENFLNTKKITNSYCFTRVQSEDSYEDIINKMFNENATYEDIPIQGALQYFVPVEELRNKITQKCGKDLDEIFRDSKYLIRQLKDNYIFNPRYNQKETKLPNGMTLRNTNNKMILITPFPYLTPNTNIITMYDKNSKEYRSELQIEEDFFSDQNFGKGTIETNPIEGNSYSTQKRRFDKYK